MATDSHFTLYDNIVTLDLSNIPVHQSNYAQNQIRIVTDDDFEIMMKIDQAAFSSPWQLDGSNLNSAISESIITYLISEGDQPVGYLLADCDDFSAHLSRIAVHPESTGKGFGSQLLNNFLQELEERHVYHATVNTQEHNSASMALYKKFGFQLTGDRIPVFRYDALDLNDKQNSN